MLAGTFRERCKLAQLGERATWALLEHLAHAGIAGGTCYDAQIAAAAHHAGATTLLTWNVEHFVRVAPEGLQVETP